MNYEDKHFTVTYDLRWHHAHAHKEVQIMWYSTNIFQLLLIQQEEALIRRHEVHNCTTHARQCCSSLSYEKVSLKKYDTSRVRINACETGRMTFFSQQVLSS